LLIAYEVLRKLRLEYARQKTGILSRMMMNLTSVSQAAMLIRKMLTLDKELATAYRKTL
jgi:hypothetical protein